MLHPPQTLPNPRPRLQEDGEETSRVSEKTAGGNVAPKQKWAIYIFIVWIAGG